MTHLKFIKIFIVATLLICTGMTYAAETVAGVGVRVLELPDPISKKPMKATFFYPTAAHSEVTKLGPIELPAKRDALPAAGRYPLIVLSHGNGGSMFSHHDTATYLAGRGMVVAAIEHPGDNFRDDSGVGSDRVLVGRNLQVTALLDFLLSNQNTANLIDEKRIGVMGFSAGGYTALLMLGAKPSFSLALARCAGDEKNNPACLPPRPDAISSPPLVVKADDRIRSAFVMSPLALFFDKESMAAVVRPVYLYAAAEDAVLPLAQNALRVKQYLPNLTKYQQIPEAGHFVFLTPCNAQMKEMMPRLCVDPKGVDRVAIHQQINAEALQFFNTTLQNKQ